MSQLNQNSYISNKQVIVIAGPTASGKSDIANLLGSKINGEIISADSMQIYRGMDIGTGKIKKNEMSVPHWGLDVVDPNKPYSAALFQEYSRNKIDEICERKHIPIICGGTGFYIRSVVDDYNFSQGEQENNPIREKWQKFLVKNDPHKLWLELDKVDSNSASVIHENNIVRVIRALEMHENGQSYAERLNNLASIKQYYKCNFFALQVDPDTLRNNIDLRVDNMINNGLMKEVKKLLKEGYKKFLTSSSAIGYKELIPYLDGEITLDKAINNIKTHTHQYAKRQRSWFRSDKRYIWIPYNKKNPQEAVDFIINNLN